MKWINIISILFIFLFAKQLKMTLPKKLVGITSAFNPKYNSILDNIKTAGLGLGYGLNCLQNGNSTNNNHNYNLYKLSKSKNNQNYINRKSKLLLSNQQSDIYLKQNEFLKDKKIISISPGGLKGFYLMGVVAYIKENYNLDPFIFSGASAGAWNALFMVFKKEPIEIVTDIIDDSIKKAESISELEHIMKYKLLTSYKSEDFDLKRLFVGITTFSNFKVNTNIFSDFDDLEDALNCCIASSHIPLITGGITNKYHNVYAFDGGFSKYPYLNITKPVLHITPSMWDLSGNGTFKKTPDIFSYSALLAKRKYDFMELFDNGYKDAQTNKEFLDSIFIQK